MNEYIFFDNDKSTLEYLKKLYRSFSNYFPNDFDEFGRLEDILVFINGRYFQYFTNFIEKENLIGELIDSGINLNDRYVFNNFFYYSIYLLQSNRSIFFSVTDGNESGLIKPKINRYTIKVGYKTETLNDGFHHVPIEGFFYSDQIKENIDEINYGWSSPRSYKLKSEGKNEDLLDIWIQNVQETFPDE